jgi:hypothetical protein
VGLNRGAWTREEDLKLIHYITSHGEGSWRTLPKAAGIYKLLANSVARFDLPLLINHV